MPKFTVNAERYDPYRNHKFKIKIDNQYVAGLSKCSPLKVTTEPIEWREGGDPSTPHKLVTQTKYEAVTLTGGVTHDTTFENWARLVHNFRGDASMSLKNFRKNITIDVMNEQDEVALSYNVFNCWVSEYQALPELDAMGKAVMITTIKLENEGWERDTSIPEPKEI
jgi:phage tail-like protein